MKPRIILRKERTYDDGAHPLSLAISLQGKKVVIGLGMSAKPEEVSRDGMIKPRAANAKDRNAILLNHLAKANEILVRYRLQHRELSANAFRSEWKTKGAGGDFVEFMEAELERLLRLEIAELHTVKLHRAALAKVKKFTGGRIHFADITARWLEDFDAWLAAKAKTTRTCRSDGLSLRFNTMRTMRKFFRIAIRDGIYCGSNPFGSFKLKAPPSTLTYLTKKELGAMWNLWTTSQDLTELAVLRIFLMGCLTGLRHSDLVRLSKDSVQSGRLVVDIYKGRKTVPKRVELPITPMVQKLLDAAPLPLTGMSEQYRNRVLKRLAEKAGIGKRLHLHVGRHTFATMFLESGGSLEVLQSLLGLSSYTTTLIYGHITAPNKQAQMDRMAGYLLLDQPG